MTKLESAKIIVSHGGDCPTVECSKTGCCLYGKCIATGDSKTDDEDIQMAQQYIDEHGGEDMNLKIGDKVKWNGSKDDSMFDVLDSMESILKSVGVTKITEIDNDTNICRIEGGDCYYFDARWFDKIKDEVKFKIGDKVKWVGSEADFECRETYLNFKKEHVVIYIDYNDNTCLLRNCGDYWFNLDWFDKIKDEDEDEDEVKFNVGDLVKCKAHAMPYFSGVKFVKKVDGVMVVRLENCPYRYMVDELELVYSPVGKDVEYEVGEKYLVSDDKTFLNDVLCDNARILIAYLPNSNYPFVCVSLGEEHKYEEGEEFSTTCWKYAKPVPEKKYKAYENFNPDWIGKKVLYEDHEWEIVGKTGIFVVLWDDDEYEQVTLTGMLDYTDVKGKPFGEEIQ